MADFPLTPAQRAAVEHRNGPLLIAAGAGSGKTRVLVERLLDRILRDDLDLDRFLLITYTRAAAAELRSRIQDALSQALDRDPGSLRLRRQLTLVNRASIGTIHSFCASVLRKHAVLCALRPDFRQLEPDEEAVIRGEVLEALLETRYGEMEPGFSLLADNLGSGMDDSALKQAVLRTFEQVQSHPDPEAWLREQWEAPVPAGDAAETPWGALLLSSAGRRAEFWLRQLLSAREKLAGEPRLEAGYGPALEGAAQSIRAFRAALEEGWDAARAAGPIAYPALRGPRGMGDHPLALEIKALWDRCKKRMKQVTDQFTDSSGDHNADFQAVRPVTDALFRLTADFSRAYGEEKRRRNVLDFSDLEHLSLRLLTEEDGAPSPLAGELSAQFEEILVDEYQDCNRVQERIFRAISREGKNITMVGDVKQSIYRFRLADPSLFLEKYTAYRDEPEAGEGRRVLLRENFRSDAGILRGVNDLFSRILTRELGELDYGEAEALIPGAGASDTPGSFELRLAETGGPGLEAEAEAVSLRVSRLLEEGIRVKDKAGDRPLAAGDIAILLRGAKDRDRIFAAALERRGIPSVCLKGGDSFTERREVIWALSLLQIIDNPRQDIPLVAALRSPVWSFSADQLAALRTGTREGCLYDALAARGETDALCAKVLKDLEDYRLLAADLPADRLLTELYARTGLPAAAEAREKGSSLWLEELVRRARDLGRTGCRGLFRFVLRLREAEERQAASASPGISGGGVRITTMHDSKGLEYPVVILADLGRQFHRASQDGPILIHPQLGAGCRRRDPDRGIVYDTLPRLAVLEQLRRENLSEELRVLYVAMTRARQKLVVFLRCRDRVKTMNTLGLWASEPIDPQALADCSCMGEWILIAALAQGQAGPWSLLPAELSPAEETAAAPEVLPPPEESGTPEEELRAVLRWRYPRAADTRLPSKLTATALRETARQAEAGEAAEELRQEGTPPPGEASKELKLPAFLSGEKALSPAERGTALHLAMQYARPEACRDPESAAAEVARLREKRFLRPEQAAAVDPRRLSDWYASPLGRRVLAAEGVHREFKFSLLAPASLLDPAGQGEMLLQGVVDCWLEEPEGITVIDYKTDRVSRSGQAARAAEYAPQLRAYAWALERITGKRVNAAYLYFFSTGEAIRLDLGKE